MADTELIVNVSVEEPVGGIAAERHERPMRGRWTARLRAKRIERFKSRQGKVAARVGPDTEQDGHQLNRGAKSDRRNNSPSSAIIRQDGSRLDGSVKTDNDDNHSAKGNKSDHTTSRKRKRSDTVTGQLCNLSSVTSADKPVIRSSYIVSSLFSSNPEIPAVESIARIAQTPSNAPRDHTQFSTLALHPRLQANLKRAMALASLTKIQELAIPHLLTSNSSDTLIYAETGSGKTLAFLLPILHHLFSINPPIDRTSGLFAIILAPTRELARQIYLICEKIIHPLVTTYLVGGEKKKSEKARLRKGVNILIATPGRLLDHLNTTKRLDTSLIKWLVLDEGDRLVELGFEETISKIVSHLDKHALEHRSTILCSATMDKNALKLSHLALREPETIHATQRNELSLSIPAQLDQAYILIPAKLRLVTLFATIKHFGQKVIVFVSCSDSVEFLQRIFSKLTSLKVYKIHGSLSQTVRVETLLQFRKDHDKAILFSTDVMARGMDLPSVELVIQYDAPYTVNDYVHRIGRTARAGASGRALLFLLPTEQKYTSYLAAQKAIIARQLDYVDFLKSTFNSLEQNWQDQATEWHLKVERWVLKDENTEFLARQAFASYLRAYTTHERTQRDMFNLRHLHLGHTAKSFGLRDPPSSVNVQQMQPKNKHCLRMDVGTHKVDIDEEDILRQRAKLLTSRAALAEEFNIG